MNKLTYILLLFAFGCTINNYPEPKENDSTIIDSITVIDTIKVSDELLAWADSMWNDFTLQKDAFVDSVEAFNLTLEEFKKDKIEHNKWIKEKSDKLDSIQISRTDSLNEWRAKNMQILDDRELKINQKADSLQNILKASQASLIAKESFLNNTLKVGLNKAGIDTSNIDIVVFRKDSIPVEIFKL